MHPWPRQIGDVFARPGAAVERWPEAEREQLVLWLPAALGAGIAAWFLLPDPRWWVIALLVLSGVAACALAVGRTGRLAQVIAIGCVTAMLGLGLIWTRAERVAAPVLGGPTIATVTAMVERVEMQPARDRIRLTLRPIVSDVALPPVVRVNVALGDAPAGLGDAATVRLRARLMPPPQPALPGAYDYARVAWFTGIGATGRAFGPIAIVVPGKAGGGLRARLSRHITQAVPGSEGGIAAALATGDVGAIGDADSEAMRRAGLAHLLSVSGLHITAVVGATMLVMLRLLALSPWLALNARLPLIAAGFGALAAIGYTLLTGSEVPTVRSCVAALLVLAAIALGREAMTLRLVATGATVVLLFRPEAVTGASFQLSFAAITAIVALHDHPRMRDWFGPHEEGWARRALRGLASLLMTGLLVEAALLPIAVYHFHKAGLYGALANIVAIPLTTFVVMPLEAGALLLDLAGLGAPLWWLVERSLAGLLWLAHRVAAAPGSVAALPAMPGAAFAAMVTGGLWLALWRSRVRRLGLIGIGVGAAWALATPVPDLLVTGDGRHVAMRMPGGGLAMLRDRAGDYTRDMLAENGGVDGAPLLLADQPGARCNRDACVTDVMADGRRWTVAATRSAYLMPIAETVALCRAVHIIVSDRRLPRTCGSRWLKLDRPVLARTGGVAVVLATGRVTTVRQAGDRHPWRDPPLVPRPVREGREARGDRRRS
ncbi:competence protein ComEC [Sphingomonas sp. Leaf17]|uniref:ComEC/Rec2 family competence protein n=1 Tax=Sphingomonas sp. Leaf17 TaxID=1735683 RepID=UPI0006F29FFC|nr:ComEC/Rec2 family competence protein [Sphingomonas sp. Leaf17]KQM65109.1 competence protein ComEC [Sphingomonas sp. Leaf17]